jgi:hypothetical protein
MIDSLRDDWQRNPRLRLGAGLVLAILVLWALLAADDALSAQRESLSRLRVERDRLQQLQKEVHWPEQRDALRLLDAHWRGRSWKAASEGRMQAQFQDWLRAQLQASGVKPRELNVAVLADEGPLQRLRARASGEVNPLNVHELLLRLNDAPGLTRVTRLVVRNTPPQSSIELELEALYEGAQPAAATASEPTP